MRPTRDTYGALVLLALCAAYGFEATHIDLFPGQESEPFRPNTLPYTLAISGMALIAIRRRNFIQHKEWMIRSYVVTFAFVTF